MIGDGLFDFLVERKLGSVQELQEQPHDGLVVFIGKIHQSLKGFCQDVHNRWLF